MDELKGLTEILNSPATSVASRWRRIGPLVDRELHRIASGLLRQPAYSHPTIEPSELVSEFYLRTLRMEKTGWANRRHFFTYAGACMRNILIDRHRTRKAHRRAGAVPLGIDQPEPAALPLSHLELNVALEKLRNLNARHAMIVELRFFAGSSVAEIAAAMDLSEKTVQRDWLAARAFLYSELAGDRREA